MTQTSKKNLIKSVTESLLEKLQIEASVDVEEKEDAFLVNIATEDSGVLIGYHGRTLGSLQVLISQIVFKQVSEWLHILVDIGDYRQRRQEQLREMAESLASEVVRTNEPKSISNLSSFERRIVHTLLSENPDVITESIGEGLDRQLIIKKK